MNTGLAGSEELDRTYKASRFDSACTVRDVFRKRDAPLDALERADPAGRILKDESPEGEWRCRESRRPAWNAGVAENLERGGCDTP